MQKEKLIIILTVLVDVIGIGIVIPTLPFYVENFGVSDFIVTLLFAVFSLFSFLSAPLLGSLSDKYGRRPILIISIASTAIGWFIFSSAKNIWFLFLGRIIDGAAAGNFPIAQSYLSDISKDDKERTANMGIIGAVFGVGFIIGPVLGGVLSHISPSFPFLFAGILALINTIAAILFLPETHKHRDHVKIVSFNPLKPMIKMMDDSKPLKYRYAAWFSFGLAIAAQQAIFALFLDHSFGFKADASGYIFAAMGALMVLNQGFLLRKFWLKKFEESKLEVWLFLLFGLSYVLLSFQVLPVFTLGLLISIAFQPVLRVVISSRVAGLAGHHRKGEILGLMSSIISAAMVAGPILGGLLFQFNESLPFIVAAVFMTIGFLIMKNSPVVPEHLPDEELIEPEAL